MWIDEFDRHEFVVGDGIRGRDAERVFEDRFDGAPDVDYLETAFEQGGGFVGEVVGYAFGGGGVGLVDVDALDGATEGLRDWSGDWSIDWGWGLGWLLCLWCKCGGLAAGVNRLTAYGVVEDKDF